MTAPSPSALQVKVLPSVVPLTVKGLRDSLEDRKHFFQRRDCYLHVGNPAKAPSAENRSEVAEFISDIEGQVRKKYAEL